MTRASAAYLVMLRRASTSNTVDLADPGEPTPSGAADQDRTRALPTTSSDDDDTGATTTTPVGAPGPAGPPGATGAARSFRPSG